MVTLNGNTLFVGVSVHTVFIGFRESITIDMFETLLVCWSYGILVNLSVLSVHFFPL